MQTYVSLPYLHPADPPMGFDEFRMPPILVESLLDDATDPNDRVLDPFAGFGTTVRVAERLDREAWAIEYDDTLVEYARGQVDHPDRVLHDDAIDADAYDCPTVDCVLTSPPFMVRGMDANPFENYAGDTDYEAYLADLRTAFENVRSVLAHDGRVLVDVANIENEGEVTTLAWDAAQAIDDVDGLHFSGERVVTWQGEGPENQEGSFGYGYDHSYVLGFDAVEA